MEFNGKEKVEPEIKWDNNTSTPLRLELFAAITKETTGETPILNWRFYVRKGKYIFFVSPTSTSSFEPCGRLLNGLLMYHFLGSKNVSTASVLKPGSSHHVYYLTTDRTYVIFVKYAFTELPPSKVMKVMK
jgi:hypothetical protein